MIYSVYLCACVETIVFYGLAWLVLRRNEQKWHVATGVLLSALVVGRLFLDVPVRILDFPRTLYSLMPTVNSLVAIFFAWLNYRDKRVMNIVLSVVIMILMNTCAHTQWLAYMDYQKGVPTTQLYDHH